ncbi:unnamed protein product [Lota lota]
MVFVHKVLRPEPEDSWGQEDPLLGGGRTDTALQWYPTSLLVTPSRQRGPTEEKHKQPSAPGPAPVPGSRGTDGSETPEGQALTCTVSLPDRGPAGV